MRVKGREPGEEATVSDGLGFENEVDRLVSRIDELMISFGQKANKGQSCCPKPSLTEKNWPWPPQKNFRRLPSSWLKARSGDNRRSDNPRFLKPAPHSQKLVLLPDRRKRNQTVIEDPQRPP